MKIPESFLQQVKDLDTLEIIGQFVTMKKKSSNYVGSCPFHDEKSPSFTYRPSKGDFHCFGCNAGGSNAIDFIMELESLTFSDAVYRAAYLGGLPVDMNTDYKPTPRPKQAAKVLPVDYVPFDAVRTNLAAMADNFLYVFFNSWFGEGIATASFLKYKVGTCQKLGKGTTMFIQFDLNGNFRHVKAILYNPSNGKRIKEFDPVYIGKAIVSKYTHKPYTEINLTQCFFGQHLLEGNNKPAAIVESEKTAMICDLYYPQYVWLATGGKNGCRWYSKEILEPLAGRDIFLFPDHDALTQWAGYVGEIKAATGCNVVVMDIFNGKQAPEGKGKYDLADLIIDSERKPPIILEDSQIEYVGTETTLGENIILPVKTKSGELIEVVFDAKGEPTPNYEGFTNGYFMGNHAAMRIASRPP